MDLSRLADRGVFKGWNVRFFESVRIGPQGEIAWGKDIDLGPDALCMRLTGKTPEHIFPSLKKTEWMPEISRFYGIVVKMYFDDHSPPNLHAQYSGYEALININTLALISGSLPAGEGPEG